MNEFLAILIAAAVGALGVLAVDLLVLGKTLVPAPWAAALLALHPILQLAAGAGAAILAFRRATRTRAAARPDPALS